VMIRIVRRHPHRLTNRPQCILFPPFLLPWHIAR
jgi:hypothetical protein